MPLYIWSFSAFGTFLPDPKEYSRLKALSISLFCSNTEMNLIHQYSQKCSSSTCKRLKGTHKNFNTELKIYHWFEQHHRTICQWEASCPASCQQDSWALRLKTTELTYIETLLYHSKVCYWTWLFHSNGLQTSWVEDRLTSHDFFPECFYCQGSNNASC